MSLFQCEHCGCCENTSFAGVAGFRYFLEDYDWSYAPERKGKRLCTACGPKKYRSGDRTEFGGKWHGEFKRRFLPLGMFKTNAVGNLEHIESGEEDFIIYEIEKPDHVK